jgi:hypothetical protein
VCGSAHGRVRAVLAAVCLVVYGSAAVRVCVWQCGGVRQCARQCGAVGGSAHGSVRAVRAAVCVSALDGVCGSVRLSGSAAMCSSAGVCCSVQHGERQCVAVCSMVSGSVLQCPLAIAQLTRCVAQQTAG